MSRYAVIAIALVAASAGGYVVGRRSSSAPSPATSAASTSGPSPAQTSGLPQTGAGDCPSVRAQLALCMAYHPPADEKDKYLTMCRTDLDLCRTRPTLPDCYAFIDLAPIYDRELGEADPSPETLERAKNLSAAECVQVITWSTRASVQQDSCLKGETPPRFKERYASPIRDRPFVKACRRTDAMNAWFVREEARIREMGYEPRVKLRVGGDAGLLLTGPDGGLIPWVPEEMP